MTFEQITAVLNDFKRQGRENPDVVPTDVNGLDVTNCALWEIALQFAVQNELDKEYLKINAGYPFPLTRETLKQFLKSRGWVDSLPGQIYSWKSPYGRAVQAEYGGYDLFAALELELSRSTDAT
jgi:hypothetical protein